MYTIWYIEEIVLIYGAPQELLTALVESAKEFESAGGKMREKSPPEPRHCIPPCRTTSNSESASYCTTVATPCYCKKLAC